MARVELTFPETVVYAERLVLRATDMSWAGHLGFDKLVNLLQQVQTRFFEHCGLPPGDGRGVGTIVSDLAVVYHGEAHTGDLVSVEVGPGESGEKWLELYFRLRRTPGDEEVALQGAGQAASVEVEGRPMGAERSMGQANVATAKLAVLCYDYDRGRAVAFPPSVKKGLAHGRQ